MCRGKQDRAAVSFRIFLSFLLLFFLGGGGGVRGVVGGRGGGGTLLHQEWQFSDTGVVKPCEWLQMVPSVSSFLLIIVGEVSSALRSLSLATCSGRCVGSLPLPQPPAQTPSIGGRCRKAMLGVCPWRTLLALVYDILPLQHCHNRLALENCQLTDIFS